MSKPKVLVTGHRGFLGRYVKELFEEGGYEVIGLDLPDKDLLTDHLNLLGFDGVIHLAAMKGIKDCDVDPINAEVTNIHGTTRLLNACHRDKVPYFVYVSTWAVNSPNKKMYDVTKKAAEEITLHYALNKNLQACVVRLGTCYGKGMAKEGVINAFIQRKKEGKPAIIKGDGSEIRQFTHARDVANGLFIAYEKGKTGATYMLVAEEVTSIIELAQLICDGNVEMVDSDMKPEDYDIYHSDDLKKLGWQQYVKFKDGVKEMMDE